MSMMTSSWVYEGVHVTAATATFGNDKGMVIAFLQTVFIKFVALELEFECYPVGKVLTPRLK